MSNMGIAEVSVIVVALVGMGLVAYVWARKQLAVLNAQFLALKEAVEKKSEKKVLTIRRTPRKAVQVRDIPRKMENGTIYYRIAGSAIQLVSKTPFYFDKTQVNSMWCDLKGTTDVYLAIEHALSVHHVVNIHRSKKKE